MKSRIKSEVGRALTRYMTERDPALLSAILADKVEFRSPFKPEPELGREACVQILKNAYEVISDIEYRREVASGSDLVLGFTARIGGTALTGVQFLRLDRKGRIAEFDIFLSPVSAMEALGVEMGKRLQAA